MCCELCLMPAFLSVCLSVFLCASVVPARGQVDEGEDVVLNEAGEAKEDRVEEQTGETQASVQRPLVEVNSQHLDGWADR